MPGGKLPVAMQRAHRHHRYTYDDYVGLELVSSTKHEFLDGEIYAMAGGTADHSALSVAVIAALAAATRDGPCQTHTSDLRVYVESVGLATFPDVSVICGPIEQHPPSPASTALNPSLLVEVTSDSSEDYDTGEKADFYRTIPSLHEYVIVSHRERRITLHHRVADGSWTLQVAVAGGRVPIESLGTELVVDDIYRKTRILSLIQPK
jgi:Uma2 family endonuclease